MNYPIRKPRGHIHYMDRLHLPEPDLFHDEDLSIWNPGTWITKCTTVILRSEAESTPVIDVVSQEVEP